PERWERLVGAIMSAAAPELRRRAVTKSPLLLLGEWFRPALAGSATVAALAMAAVLFVGGSQRVDLTARIADGIGLPTEVSTWMRSGEIDALNGLVLAPEELSDD